MASSTASDGLLAAAVFPPPAASNRSEEHTSELQSQSNLVCRLLLEKKKKLTHLPRRPEQVHAMRDESAELECRTRECGATLQKRAGWPLVIQQAQLVHQPVCAHTSL